MARRRSFVKRTNKKNRNRNRTRNRTNKKNRTKRINQKGGAFELKNTLEGHTAGVESVAFHPDPRMELLATGSMDTTTRLWRLKKRWFRSNKLATLMGHSKYIRFDSILSVAFHPTAPLLATGSGDYTAKLWLLKKGLFSSPATYVATLEGHLDIVKSVAFHPTELLLATGSSDSTAKLWSFEADGSTTACVATLERPPQFVTRQPVNSVAFHPKSKNNLVATGYLDNIAIVWRGALTGIKWMDMAVCRGHTGSVNSVAFYPNTEMVLLATGSSDDTAKLWHVSSSPSPSSSDLWTATCVATLEGHSDAVLSVAFHPTAPLLATGSYDKTAKLWSFSPDGSRATCVATLEGHRRTVQSVAFHPTAPLLATGSEDKTAKLWNIEVSDVFRGEQPMNSLPLPATAAAEDDRQMHIVEPDHVNIIYDSDDEDAPLLN